ncbi:MAG: hypothetical protein RIT45_512 [Pseudomonadota bacterium]|jgi:Cu-processing system permease protein
MSHPPPPPLRNAWNVALDVVREALARRTVLGILAALGLGQVGLALALDLDVVEGAIVSSELLGDAIGLAKRGGGARDQLRPVFEFMAHAVFHLGMIFGIVATSDIASRALSPGRVELLLSLPVRRIELVLGTYLGVGLVALGGTLFAVGGFSAVLLWKVGVATPAPLLGAVAAAYGFAAVYAAMLLATTLARSPALAAGIGMLLYIVASATSRREAVLSWFERGWPRDVAAVVLAPLPRLLGVSRLGADFAGGNEIPWHEASIALGTTGLFAAAALAAAAWVVQGRDW